MNNQLNHGAGKQYSGCTYTGEFLAATPFMRRKICFDANAEGFLRTNNMMPNFNQYFYKGVLCADPGTYIVTSGGYGEAYMKSVDFPGALY